MDSLPEWLIEKRNNGCPLHGYQICKSLTKYSGYCSTCNQFWRFRRNTVSKKMPYFWYYFNPNNPKEKIGILHKG